MPRDPQALPVNSRPIGWPFQQSRPILPTVPDPPRGVCPVCGASVGMFAWSDGPQKDGEVLKSHPLDPLACGGETWRESCPGSACPAGVGPPERAA